MSMQIRALVMTTFGVAFLAASANATPATLDLSGLGRRITSIREDPCPTCLPNFPIRHEEEYFMPSPGPFEARIDEGADFVAIDSVIETAGISGTLEYSEGRDSLRFLVDLGATFTASAPSRWRLEGEIEGDTTLQVQLIQEDPVFFAFFSHRGRDGQFFEEIVELGAEPISLRITGSNRDFSPGPAAGRVRFSFTPVPEPSTALLLAAGLATLAARRRVQP